MKPTDLAKFIRVRYREFRFVPMKSMDKWNVETELGVPLGVGFPSVARCVEWINETYPLEPDAMGYLPVLSIREIILQVKTEVGT